MPLPKGFRPLPPEQSARKRRIDLVADGIEATYDELLTPEFWRDALDVQVNDEIELIARSWRRVVRVISVGPEGAVCDHVAKPCPANLGLIIEEVVALGLVSEPVGTNLEEALSLSFASFTRHGGWTPRLLGPSAGVRGKTPDTTRRGTDAIMVRLDQLSRKTLYSPNSRPTAGLTLLKSQVK